MERRSSTRFTLNLPVRYSLVESGCVIARGLGRTLDLGSGGVLIQSEDVPIPSGKVEVSIAWPVPLDGGIQLQLFVTGSVLRQDGNTTAVSLDRYEFRTKSRVSWQAEAPAPRNTRRVRVVRDESELSKTSSG